MKKALVALTFVGLIAFGVWRWWDGSQDPGSRGSGSTETGGVAVPAAALRIEGRVETKTEVPALPPAGLYQMNDGVFDLELREYGGYAGLIAANGGLEPSENSYFFRNHGFKVRITLSEEESWSALNRGRIGGSATTVDMLAVHARTLQAVVPAQIGFSRGADTVVVTPDVTRVNHLKGRVLITSQFTEADFFIRYLASEAGLEVRALTENERPDPEMVNLIYAEDTLTAGDIFAAHVSSGGTALAGAVVHGPKAQDVLERTGDKARRLVDNRNILVVADVLVINKPFAQANPKIVEGLVDGMLAGNEMVRDQIEQHLDVIARAFTWTHEQARSELAQVYLSNHPENRAFFFGTIDAAGSYGGIFASTMLAYGSLLDHSMPAERLLDLKLETFASKYAHQTALIEPIRTASNGAVEGDPLLTRDVRFYFEPNSAVLGASAENDRHYESARKLLQVSPGSKLLLRGHVDNARISEFRREGEEFLSQRALEAMELSRKRADAVRTELIRRYRIPADRVAIVGRGWEEPAGTDSDRNRRVEVQWFTLE